MKINLKNVALVLLAIAGGVGASVAAISSASKTKSSSVAKLSDSSMGSMQPDASSCEMCSNGSSSKCTDGSCPKSQSMMNMTPSMDSAKMADAEQMSVAAPKM